MSFDGRSADELAALAHERIAAGEGLANALEGLKDLRRGDEARDTADAALKVWDRVSGLMPSDVGHMAHRVAIAHLTACWEFYDAHEDMATADLGPASAPFCGCTDCEVREILFAAWPVFVGASG